MAVDIAWGKIIVVNKQKRRTPDLNEMAILLPIEPIPTIPMRSVASLSWPAGNRTLAGCGEMTVNSLNPG